MYGPAEGIVHTDKVDRVPGQTRCDKDQPRGFTLGRSLLHHQACETDRFVQFLFSVPRLGNVRRKHRGGQFCTFHRDLALVVRLEFEPLGGIWIELGAHDPKRPSSQPDQLALVFAWCSHQTIDGDFIVRPAVDAETVVGPQAAEERKQAVCLIVVQWFTNREVIECGLVPTIQREDLTEVFGGFLSRRR